MYPPPLTGTAAPPVGDIAPPAVRRRAVLDIASSARAPPLPDTTNVAGAPSRLPVHHKKSDTHSNARTFAGSLLCHFAHSTTTTKTPAAALQKETTATVKRHAPLYELREGAPAAASSSLTPHRMYIRHPFATGAAFSSTTPCRALEVETAAEAANSSTTVPRPCPASLAAASSVGLTTQTSSLVAASDQAAASGASAAVPSFFQPPKKADTTGCYNTSAAVQKTALFPPPVGAEEGLKAAKIATAAATEASLLIKAKERLQEAASQRGGRRAAAYCEPATVGSMVEEAAQGLGTPALTTASGVAVGGLSQVPLTTALPFGRTQLGKNIKEAAEEEAAALLKRTAVFSKAETGDPLALDALSRHAKKAWVPNRRTVAAAAEAAAAVGAGNSAPQQHPLRRAWTAWQLLCFAAPPPGTSSLEKQYINESLSLVKGYLCDAEAAHDAAAAAAAVRGLAVADRASGALEAATENSLLLQRFYGRREEQSPLDTSDEDSDDDDEENIAVSTAEQQHQQQQADGALTQQKSHVIRRKTYALFSGPDFARLLRLAQAEGGEFKEDIQQWLGDYRARLNRAFEDILARIEERLHPLEDQTETEEQRLQENLANLDAIDEAAVAEALDSLPDTEGFAEELRLSEEGSFVDRSLQETDRVIHLHEMLQSKLRQELQELDNHLADLKKEEGRSDMQDASNSSTVAAVTQAVAATTTEAGLSAGEEATHIHNKFAKTP